MNIFLTILYVLLYIGLAILCWYVIVWVLGLFGISVPDNIRKVFLGIAILLICIWALSGGIYMPFGGVHHISR